MHMPRSRSPLFLLLIRHVPGCHEATQEFPPKFVGPSSFLFLVGKARGGSPPPPCPTSIYQARCDGRPAFISPASSQSHPIYQRGALPNPVAAIAGRRARPPLGHPISSRPLPVPSLFCRREREPDVGAIAGRRAQPPLGPPLDPPLLPVPIAERGEEREK